MDHVKYRCPGAPKCTLDYQCTTCTLFFCEVCRTVEGTLTTDCPGEPVTAEMQEEIYSGRLDYRESEGGWVNKLSPTMQSHIKAQLFNFYKGSSRYGSESEIILKFGIDKQEFSEIKASVVKYLAGG